MAYVSISKAQRTHCGLMENRSRKRQKVLSCNKQCLEVKSGCAQAAAAAASRERGSPCVLPALMDLGQGRAQTCSWGADRQRAAPRTRRRGSRLERLLQSASVTGLSLVEKPFLRLLIFT